MYYEMYADEMQKVIEIKFFFFLFFFLIQHNGTNNNTIPSQSSNWLAKFAPHAEYLGCVVEKWASVITQRRYFNT